MNYAVVDEIVEMSIREIKSTEELTDGHLHDLIYDAFRDDLEFYNHDICVVTTMKSKDGNDYLEVKYFVFLKAEIVAENTFSFIQD